MNDCMTVTRIPEHIAEAWEVSRNSTARRASYLSIEYLPGRITSGNLFNVNGKLDENGSDQSA
ncbi:MAG: hypothetical protein LBC65_01720, partial [Oscillospiraceae bacterium]|nr:hypothetical protein [Oscillospiraceae bacterium]